ncbi:MAG: AMP-binding protein, partial [Cyanobacteria bacterium NC_groundwater_1444_Ag_S-0.65um_54_12]|nr:AMP-binding protein [Cyanobacteria bacterium NC_groundwater_1444_Ag_S-0.65um_54_12]
MNGTYLSSPIPLGEVESSIGTMLQARALAFGDRIACKERKKYGQYVSLDWPELMQRVRRSGTALLALGVAKGDRLAVYSRNTEEMLCWELAVMSIGAISVPIFSRYSAEQVNYLLEHSAARMILVPDDEQAQKVKQTAYYQQLERIFMVETPAVQPADSRYMAFSELLASAETAAFATAVHEVQPTDPCLIMYTSGTTGLPKGVVLTHRNLLSQQKALTLLWRIKAGDVFLSYLPWHHSFGGLFERFTALCSGALLCLDDSYGRDIARMIHNWQEIKPTHFFSVPKIFNALVTEARLDPRIDRVLFHPGLKFVFTAAAPLPADCSDYFANKGIPVLEGWGLTETSPCVTLTAPDMERLSSIVGRPIPGVEVLVAENSEILVRGPNVMSGYYQDPERTA